MHKLMCTFMTPMKKKIPDRNLDTSCPAGIPCKKSGNITTRDCSLRIAGVTAHSVTEFLRFFTGKKSDACSVHMYNYNARTIRMLRALWSYKELSLTNHSACLTLAIL